MQDDFLRKEDDHYNTKKKPSGAHVKRVTKQFGDLAVALVPVLAVVERQQDNHAVLDLHEQLRGNLR